MKLAIRISSIIILLLLILVSTMLVSAAQKYPDFINGEPVIFVQTSENTLSLDSNTVVLTILDDSNSMEESMAKFSDYLGNHQLPKGWSIEVVGGPGVSAEECLQVHNSFNDAVIKNGGLDTAGPVPLATSLGVTFAIDAPSDPSSETITDIIAEWIAPQVGSYQNHCSFLLVNGWTDQNYFMQSGEYYKWGTGYHVWADNASGLYPVPFDAPYVAGQDCQYFIAKFSVGWTMALSNKSTGGYYYYIETNAVGTKLVKNRNTSVFFENQNTNSNWYSGFTNPISVYGAYDGIAYPASVHQWKNDYIMIVDTYGNQQSNNNIITGRLKNYGTASWHLDKILLAKQVNL